MISLLPYKVLPRGCAKAFSRTRRLISAISSGYYVVAGYSERSLIEKLGIKEGFKIIILNPPKNYNNTLGKLPKNVIEIEVLRGSLDFIHFSTKKRKELEIRFPSLKKALSQNGVLWISWPKGSSNVETDLDEGIIRKIGLSNGLVDVKICAVDKTWSGLKFVYRLKDRK